MNPHSAIAGLYESLDDDSGWPQALATISTLVDGVGCSLVLWNKASQTLETLMLGSEVFSDEAITEYANYYNRIDPTLELAMRLPVGALTVCDEHFSPAEIDRSEYFNDFLMRHGGRHVVGARLVDSTALMASFGVHRSRSQGAFAHEHLARLRWVVPHLQRAVHFRGRLQAAETAMNAQQAELDQVPFGLVCIDRDGRVMAVNAFAEAVLRRGDAIWIRGGRLCLADAGDQATFETALGAIIASSGIIPGAAISSCHADGSRLFLQILPASRARRDNADAAAAFVLISSSLEQATVAGRALAELFGLSPSEAQIALALARGKRLEDLIAERGVRQSTLRSQVRAILRKTGTERQADLIGLVLGLPGACDR